MPVMRELEKKRQITFWSTPEVRVVLRRLLDEANYTVGVKLGDRGELTQQEFINSIILYIDALPPAARALAFREGVGRLEAVLSGVPLPAPPSPEDLLKQVKVTDTTPKRRKTRGA